MIKLYGVPFSNYFNMVKMALLEKGMAFEFVSARPSQDDDYVAISPMGKVPCIETPDGFLSETGVILNYLEEVCPTPALLPTDPYRRAKVRELMHEMELYIELPARTCFAQALFDREVSEETRMKARANLERGMRCLAQNGEFAPYVAGSEFTLADVFFLYGVGLANTCAQKVWDWDLLDGHPGMQALARELSERDSAKQIAADQQG